MRHWLTYLKERFPLPSYFLLIGGMALIGYQEGAWSSFCSAFIGLLLFFFLLRAMDELKDYSKDRIAHPDRPLPRGLISRKKMKNVIHGLLVAMGLYALLLGGISSWETALSYGVLTFYLWAMFYDFHLESYLSKQPFLYAITHQLVVFPLSAFLLANRGQYPLVSMESVSTSLLLLGAFFFYEIGRKLNPKAPSILKTYPHVYGTVPTAIVGALLLAVAALFAYFLKVHFILWPIEILLLLALAVYSIRPLFFKRVEQLATLHLIASIYSLGMKAIFKPLIKAALKAWLAS